MDRVGPAPGERVIAAIKERGHLGWPRWSDPPLGVMSPGSAGSRPSAKASLDDGVVDTLGLGGAMSGVGRLVELHRDWAVIELAANGSRRVFERRRVDAGNVTLPWIE